MKKDVVEQELNTIARIPGKRLIVGTRERYLHKLIISAMTKLGMKDESLSFFANDPARPIYSQIRQALRYFQLPEKFYAKSVTETAEDTTTIVYYDKNHITPEQVDTLDIIEQVLGIHFIQVRNAS